MYIKEIIQTDPDAQEADVIVSDGEFDLLCYAHPFESADLGGSSLSLTAFLADRIRRATEYACPVTQTQDGYYSYRLQGRVVDLQKKLISVGKIVIEIDGDLPGDIGEGEFVEFTAMRIDLTA